MKKKKEMKLIDAVRHLDAHEALRSTLLKTGSLSPNLFSYADIFNYYTIQYNEMKKKRVKSFRGKAVAATMEKFGVSKATIYIILKQFK